jgi:hypothetical protein
MRLAGSRDFAAQSPRIFSQKALTPAAERVRFADIAPAHPARGAGQKDISYYNLRANPPGLSNKKDNSWFAALTRVVLYR